MLKQIGTKARQDIEYLLDDKVYLELWVKVQKDWRDKKSIYKILVIAKKNIKKVVFGKRVYKRTFQTLHIT